MKVNPCGPLKSLNSNYCPKDSQMCLIDGETGQPVAHFGQVNYALAMFSRAPSLILGMVNGSESSDGFPFTALVRIVCDEDGRKKVSVCYILTGQGPKIAENRTPLYQITWESDLVCGLSAPGAAHSSLATVLFKFMLFIFLLYILGGSVYRAVCLEKRGSEIVPNYQLWKDTFDILREFSNNVWKRLSGSEGGYQRI